MPSNIYVKGQTNLFLFFQCCKNPSPPPLKITHNQNFYLKNFISISEKLFLVVHFLSLDFSLDKMGKIKRNKPKLRGCKTDPGTRKTNFNDAQLLAALNENDLECRANKCTVEMIFATFQRQKIYTDAKLRPRLSEYLRLRIIAIRKCENISLNELEIVLRIFCRKLTIKINNLEQKKNDFQVDATTILNFEKKLSEQYLLLALFFMDSYSDKRECILTAFSLNPIESNFNLVVKFSKISHTNNQNSPTHLSESLRSDVQCLLTWPRIKTLSWLKPWSELKKECQLYLQPNKKIERIQMQTAVANKDLKYLNDILDYKLYESWKPYDYPGIEKGFDNKDNPDM